VLGTNLEKAVIDSLFAQADVVNAFPIDLLPAKVRDLAKVMFGEAGMGHFVG
jgi:hypothetical protein